MSFVSQIRGALVLLLALAISTSRAPAQVPSTNAWPPWPTLATVTNKYADQPMSAVERAAENGEVTAQHYLGYCYMAGLRVVADLKTSVSWYEKALRQGYLPSGFNLGLIYEGTAPDFHDDAKALHYFQLTANQGYARSKVQLARMYRHGTGVLPDNGLAFKLLEEAADQGDGDAIYYLFQAYFEGDGVGTDYAKAVQWLRKGVAAADAGCQCELAYQYENRGLKMFPEFPDNGSLMRESVRLYTLSANQGFSIAQCNLARVYLGGNHVEQDEVHGLELMRNAADQGNPDALAALAGLYAGGVGEPRDEHDRPFELLCRALLATKPSDNKYWFYWPIIDRCEAGLGTDRDLVAAAQWYCRATLEHTSFFTFAGEFDLSQPAKAVPLGVRSVSPQLRAVISTYLKAAARRDAQAALQIGTMYLTGKDAPQSAAKAWPWFTLASQYGASDAAAKISQAEAGMTAKELEQDKQQFPAFLEELKKVARAASSEAGRPEIP
jgi:TPR repeat protein